MMQIYPHLFIGSAEDYEAVLLNNPSEWFIIQAAKEPWHRDAVGYTTKGAPKESPEYLIAHRKDRLILNLVDTNDVKYISPKVINAAIKAIDKNIITGKKVLVHCNRGESRAPSIALLYMVTKGVYTKDTEEALQEFQTRYHDFHPSLGMLDFILQNWNKYVVR